MAKSKTIEVVIDEVLREAMQQHCKLKRVTQSDVVRQGICRVIGRPDLDGGIKMGAPVKEDREQPAEGEGE
jgi:hypothetical protein